METQQQADPKDERALAARHGNDFNGGHHGRRGHYERAGSRTCYYCGKEGHIERYCRKKERDEATNSKVCSAIAL